MTDERIIAYLLQELSKEEAERFEDQCFAEEEWPAELDSVEQDLIDAYLRNELSKDRHRRFEEKYLITDARKARVLTAQSFMQVLRPPQKNYLHEQIEAFLRRPLVHQAAVALLVVVVLTPLIVWTLRPSATYTRVDLAMSSPDRAAGVQMEKVKLPLSTDGLQMHLKVPESPTSAPAAYHVEWEDVNGNKLGELKINSRDNQSVVVIIPRNQLSPGRYVLKVFKTNPGGTGERVGNYFFSAE